MACDDAILDLVYAVLGSPVGLSLAVDRRPIRAHRTVGRDDALEIAWNPHGNGYLEPSADPRWIQKAVDEAAQGWEAIVRPPVSPSPAWYAHVSCVCVVDLGADPATEILYMGPRYEDFARTFVHAGHLFYPQHDHALTARITGRTMRRVSYGATTDLFTRARRCEREIRATRYHGVAVGVMNLPEQTTVREVLSRDDMPELRAILEDLTLHELGQALLLLSNDPSDAVAAPARAKKPRVEAGVDQRQLGLPVYADGRAYRNDAERVRFDRHVLDSIAASRKPMSRRDVMTLNPCTEHEYRGVISRLQHAGAIKKVGDGRHARYLAAQPPRTEQDDHRKPQPNGNSTSPSSEPRGGGEDLGGAATASG